MLNGIHLEQAIMCFRESDQKLKPNPSTPKIEAKYYLLPDFEIKEAISVHGFTIHPTKKVNLSTLTVGFVAIIDFPDWTKRHSNPVHCRLCCAYSLSLILSFVTERSIKYYVDEMRLKDSLEEAAISHPIHWQAPTENAQTTLSHEVISDRLNEILDIILKADSDTYLKIMRSCAMYQRSMFQRFTDHTLAHALMVGAIESIATKAFGIEDIISNWNDIRKLTIETAKSAGLEKSFVSLLPTKLEQHYSTARFTEFVASYAPFKSLNLPSRYEDLKNKGVPQDAIDRIENLSDPLNKKVHENRNHPEINQALNYRELVKDTYKYRSKLFHAGESGPLLGIDNNERYIKDVLRTIATPKIKIDDFSELELDASKLWSKLCQDGIVKKGNFEKDNIKCIKDSYFNGNGAEIRQILNRNSYDIIRIMTFKMLAHVARISITSYFKSNRLSLVHLTK